MNDKPKFSLQAEIKKRKTQEIIRDWENQRTAAAQGVPLSDTRQPHVASQAKRASQGTGAQIPAPRRVSPVPIAQPPTARFAASRPGLTYIQKRLLIAIAAAILIGMVGITTLLIASRAPAEALRPLPVVTADDVIAHLKKVGVGITDLQVASEFGNSWKAAQAYQFDAQLTDKKAVFIVLSYKTAEQKIPDIFRVSADGRFKTWQLNTASNIVLLAAPDADPELIRAMGSHLTQYLVAPYRGFLPTATPAA